MRLSFAQVACVVAGTGCFCALSLHAQTPPASESWLTVRAVDDACIEERSLARDVLSLLGSTTIPVGLQVQLEARGKVSTFTLRHGSGAVAGRELQDLPASCAARQEAVSLALALAIEHALAESAESSSEPETAQQPNETRSASGQAELPPADLQPRVRREIYLGLMAGPSIGRLPGVAAEGMLNVEWALGPHFSLEAEAAVSSRSRVSLAEGTLTTRLLGASVGTCAGGTVGAGRIAGCLSAGMGVALGEGEDLAQNASDVTGSGELSLAAAGRWPTRRRFAVLWRVEGFVRWLRPRFEVFDESGQAVGGRTFAPGGGRLLVGVAWRAR